MARTPKPEQTEETKARLRHAALELIGEHGLDGFSLDDLAARSQRSRSVYGRYYKTKEDLVADVVADLLTPKADSSVTTSSLQAFITAVKRSITRAMENPIRTRALFVVFGQVQTGSRFREAIADAHAASHATIKSRLDSLVTKGLIRRDVQTAEQAFALLALIRGAGLMAYSGVAGYDVERVALETASALVHALTPRDEDPG